MDRLAFEAELRRDGFDVVHGGQKPGHTADAHIMVLGGEITLIRDGKPETFRAGDHCAVPAGCLHAEQVGPEGVAYIAGTLRRHA
jgi:quercetin dioxygenase-like cupin family protein